MWPKRWVTCSTNHVIILYFTYIRVFRATLLINGSVFEYNTMCFLSGVKILDIFHKNVIFMIWVTCSSEKLWVTCSTLLSSNCHLCYSVKASRHWRKSKSNTSYFWDDKYVLCGTLMLGLMYSGPPWYRWLHGTGAHTNIEIFSPKR